MGKRRYWVFGIGCGVLLVGLLVALMVVAGLNGLGKQLRRPAPAGGVSPGTLETGVPSSAIIAARSRSP